jgi:Transposase IS66 family
VRDGYAGYEHIQAIHAWCGAHILRDLRSISDADPDGQLWALVQPLISSLPVGGQLGRYFW